MEKRVRDKTMERTPLDFSVILIYYHILFSNDIDNQ